MSLIERFLKQRKKISPNRRSLLAATFEGFPACVLMQLLGGPFLTGYLLYLGASAQQIGFSNALGSVVWTSLISDMVPAAVRGRYFGIRNTILGGVSSIVLFIGGQILEHYPGGQGFNVLFIICGICALLNMTAYFFYPNLPFETSTGIGLGGFNQMVFTLHHRRYPQKRAADVHCDLFGVDRLRRVFGAYSRRRGL
jgi:MFS family permease